MTGIWIVVRSFRRRNILTRSSNNLFIKRELSPKICVRCPSALKPGKTVITLAMSTGAPKNISGILSL